MTYVRARYYQSANSILVRKLIGTLCARFPPSADLVGKLLRSLHARANISQTLSPLRLYAQSKIGRCLRNGTNAREACVWRVSSYRPTFNFLSRVHLAREGGDVFDKRKIIMQPISFERAWIGRLPLRETLISRDSRRLKNSRRATVCVSISSRRRISPSFNTDF